MSLWCSRCGGDLARHCEELPCPQCWTGQADDALARRLIARADDALRTGEEALASIADPAARSSWVTAARNADASVRAAGKRARVAEVLARAALSPLGQIGDPRAASALRAAVEMTRPRVRAAGLRGLGRSGTRDDAGRVARCLGDESETVRSAARVALAELGGPAAADALAAHLETTVEREQVECMTALAWLRDPRALPLARRLAPGALANFNERMTVRALLQVGTEADVAALRTLMIDDIRRNGPRAPSYANMAWALGREDRDAQRTLRTWLSEDGLGLTPETTDPISAPARPRTVARMTLTELTPTPASDAWPPAKFGGQPDWLESPAWPVASDGRSLTFYGQLPLADEPARIAYVFINAGKRAETWAPLGDGNAVVTQPGPAPHLRCIDAATGPQLYAPVDESSSGFQPRSRYLPYERFVRLAPGADPPEWSPQGPEQHGDWDKIGGTPLFLQSEHTPPGDGWHFAFQFTAAWAGHELADGAQCYGFIRDDGTGALTWECH
jgi:hypothetical protein